MWINGKEKMLTEPTTIMALLKGYKLSKHVVVIHINGEIIPTDLYSKTMIKDNDRVQLTSIVGGG